MGLVILFGTSTSIQIRLFICVLAKMVKTLMGLEDKVVFVTGGTSGMGKATVLQAAANGAKVAFIGRRAPEGEAVVAQAIADGANKDNIWYIQCDVTDFSALQNVIESIVQKWGRVDGLFCCAGTHIVGDILTTTLEQRNSLRNLNVTSMFVTLKNVLPIMMKQGGGNVVLMGSDQSLIGKQKSSIYGATKAAVGQLTKSTALDYAQYNIRVNAICPGTIDTEQAARAADNFAKEKFGGDITKARDDFAQAQAMKRLGTPEEVAKLVCFLLTDQAAYMTGTLISIDGGYVAG